jgi:hypothetical protein
MRFWPVVLVATLTACGDSSSSPPAQPVVEDTTPPVINLTGDNPQYIEAGEAYTELGATATDNIDGDLSASIVIDVSTVDTTVPSDYTVTYDVSDSSGNAATTVTRTVTVHDTTPPVITLLGDDPQVIVTGDPYMELGATAADSLDGDLTAAIVIDASGVDTTKAGDYAVTYDVSDAAGNAAAIVTRVVRVQNPPLPAAPTASVEGDIKQLIFSWDAVAGAGYYRLLENADGHSGFTQVGNDIPAGTLTATRDIAVHLFDWVEARYLVEACNIGGCNSSSVITATEVMLDTIGYFKASNLEYRDGFGGNVALSADGNRLAVSALERVYVFRREDIKWYQQAVITGSNTEVDDWFGRSIALSSDGNTLAIGAPREDSSATGINGDETDNSAGGAGAVYVFRLVDGAWLQQAYIKASNTDIYDFFGEKLALSADGNVLAIGAPYEDSGATGINGDQFDDNLNDCEGDSGAVYVFRFDGVDWFQQAYVKASNTGIGEEYNYDNQTACHWGDHFGHDVSLSDDGDTLAVGAPLEDGLSSGVNGDQSNEGDITYDSGAAYLFYFDGSSWSQQAYIKPSALPAPTAVHYFFGHRVDLDASGTILAISAPDDGNSSVESVNEPPVNLNRENFGSGAAYLLRFDGNSWSHESYFKASNAEALDRFGANIALSADGSTLAVAAVGEDSNACGLGGDQSDNTADESGAVYVFRFDGLSWSQPTYVKSSNSEAEDWFGAGEFEGTSRLSRGRPLSLSETGTTMAVGAPGEDSAATGIDGDQADNSAKDSGAVYIY